MTFLFIMTAALGLGMATTAVAGEALGDAEVQKYVDAMFAKAAPEWKQRAVQDETQRVCSIQAVSELPPAEVDKIIAREKATIVYPADGNVLGDWKAGEKVASTGTGGQFTDKPDTYRGGNCYACHQMAPGELSYGTLGPSLVHYGKLRDYKPEEARAAFAKIYNAQSVVACSMMPRFGYRKFLSEQQMKDVTAYLFDPNSPVNK